MGCGCVSGKGWKEMQCVTSRRESEKSLSLGSRCFCTSLGCIFWYSLCEMTKAQFLSFPTTNTNMPMRIPHVGAPRPRLGRRYCSLTAPPRPPPIGIANLSSPRQLIEIHGRDATKYLQGLTTRNFPMLPDSQGAYSAFLNAQARTHMKCYSHLY